MGRALAAWLLITTTAAATSMTPRDTVQSATTRVVHALEGAQVSRATPSPASRAALDRVRRDLRRIAAELFDFEEVGRRALGRHWAGRSSDEQSEFVALFTDLLERAYLGRIEAYSGEKIVYAGEAVDGDYATVRSRILTRRRTETALDYRLHRAGDRWKVYDVLVDGVSFVSTYRSEFNRVIQLHSWQELMDRLRKKQIEVRTVLGRS